MLMDRADPEGLLGGGAPDDEYDDEVAEVTRRVLKNEPPDPGAIERWFSGVYGAAPEGADALARELEKLRQRVQHFESVVRGEAEGPYPCPCCGFITIPERGAYEIFPVCFWEDDGQDDHDADRFRGGPIGSLSLTEARANFERFGASDRSANPFVRRPRSGELPPDCGTRHN
jgi:hypothetical protein